MVALLQVIVLIVLLSFNNVIVTKQASTKFD